MSEGLLVAIGALITATMGGAVLLLNAWHKIRQEREASVAAGYTAIADRQEKQIARLESQLRDQQAVIAHLFSSQARCREQEAQLYGQMCHLHDVATRHAAALRKLGADIDPVPPLPDRPVWDAADEFMARTSAQTTELLRGVDDRLQRKDGEA